MYAYVCFIGRSLLVLVTGIQHDEVCAIIRKTGETWKAFQDEVFLQGQE
jgi:hypothetical protein